jgi:UDP-glucuronate decarboxylase
MNKILFDDFEKIFSYIPDYEKFRNSRWLITGSTGMLGSYLLTFLSWLNENKLGNSMKITAVHKTDIEHNQRNVKHLKYKDYIEFRQMDLGGELKVDREEKFDYIFHAASNASPKVYFEDPIGTINSNVIATRSLLEHARIDIGVKCMIYVSSGDIYGDPDIDNIPTPEEYQGRTNHLSQRSCYIESKRFAETMCWNYFHTFKVPIKIIRPAHLYGPCFKEKNSRIWVDFITRAVRGEDIEIISDGSPRRGYCYIADALVQIFAVIFKGEDGEVYNIGSEKHVSIKNMADVIASKTPHKTNVIIKNNIPEYLAGQTNIFCPSISKVSELTPVMHTSLPEGIERTIKWVLSFNEVKAT